MTNITHIQWHIGDFLGGVMQMDGAEIGAYTMLIVAHYQAGLEGLSSEDKDLMLITRTNPKIWKRIKGKVLSKFVLKGGKYIHERVCEELIKIHDKAGPGRGKTTKDDVGNPKVTFDRPTSDTQVENKLLNLNDTEKTTLKPITYNQEPLRKEKIQKEKNEFEDFWKACPRKVGKGKAEEKYWIARGEASKEEIHGAMIAHAREMKGKETEYIPHPATWLHQKRYYDETATAQIIQEKQQWPDWKNRIALTLGDHVVKTWFNSAKFVDGALIFSKRFEYDRINQFHSQDLGRIGIKEIKLALNA